jgi:hypothetical protein
VEDIDKAIAKHLDSMAFMYASVGDRALMLTLREELHKASVKIYEEKQRQKKQQTE